MSKGLGDIPIRLAWEAQQAALMRVQLYGVMETHRLLGEFGKAARGALLDSAGKEGTLDGLGLHLAQRTMDGEWQRTLAEWKRVFNALRREAAAIPFGTLVVYHRHFLGDGAKQESRASRMEEQVGVGMVGGGWFWEQLQVLLDAADRRVYEDGLTLSQRIWRLDKRSLQGIMALVYEGVATGNSAWNMAQKVEGYLGMGKECPRWARARLYQLTKQQIASGDRTGLYSKDFCAGQGVAYNALRLMRNEIQAIHHMGTDMVMDRMPWVEKEEVHLSPSHPKIGCECEDVVVSGEKGTGVYPKGTITLPIHVQCLCYKTAVTMELEEFTRQVRGWMTGAEAWGAMDQYATWLGFSPDVLRAAVAPRFDEEGGFPQISEAETADALLVWVWGDEEEVTERIEAVMEQSQGA